MMAMNDTQMIIIVLLSLTFSIASAIDYNYRTTVRQHSRSSITETSSSSPRSRYTESPNTTVTTYSDTNTRSRTIETQSRNTQKRKERVDDTIIYPDAKPKTTCTHGLCTNVENYPKEQIQKLLSRSQFMNSYFDASEEYVNIDNRFNSDEMPLCETKIHTIYPEKANNTMKVEKVIVNVEGHKQGIVFETCVDNGKCKFSRNFPTGYTSYCKQKYIHKRLMVLGDNDKFVFDSFEVPSCCVCIVTRTD